MLQPTAVNAVAFAQRPICLDVKLGHDEQADALDARRRINHTCQHQVNDVACHVVLASADENFIAGDFVSAVRQGFSLGAHQAQVGAAMRFSQAHGASPFAAGHFVQVGLLLFFSAVAVQRGVCAMREAGVHGPGLVGAVEHFIKALVDDQRQALTTKGRVATQCGPAAFHILGVRFFEALWRGHSVGGDVQFAAFFITADIERKHDLGREFRAFFEHGIDGVNVRIGILGDRLEFFCDFEHFMHHKLHVAQGWVVNRHRAAPKDESK